MTGRIGRDNTAMLGDDFLPSDDLLSEQSYLVSRGVRHLALVGLCPSDEPIMVRVATRVEQQADPTTLPFVVDHQDGTASFGYAGARWVLDLYEWSVSDKQIPPEQRERIHGLLLGYAAGAVSQFEELGSGRRFLGATASPG